MPERSINSRELFTETKNQLIVAYGKEADSLVILLFEHFFHMNRTDIVVNKQISTGKKIESDFKTAIDRLKAGEPVQYILGETYFMGRKLFIRSGVLIPRPETEELVLAVIKNNNLKNPAILDIGSGSGCITVSLALEIPGADISGWDVSTSAIEVSRLNAEYWNVNLNFEQVDILSDQIPDRSFNIIVSNPPYILESEKKFIKSNVLKHEPGSALFVKDSDPLIYFRRILDLSRNLLVPGGKIFFEINESFGQPIKKLLRDFSFSEVTLKKDIHGKDRIIFGKKPV